MRRIYVKRTEHVDNETGEITHSETSSSFFVKSRHFVKMYLDGLHMLTDLSGGARVVLDLLLIEMEFNENTVYMNKKDRIKIAEIMGKSEHTVRNYVYELEKAEVISKVGTNIYRVNPDVFKKGGKSHTNEYEASRKPSKTEESPI